MKKIVIFALVFVFIFALVACDDTKPMQLGTTAFSIVLPEGYTLKNEDMAEDQIGYFYKDDNSIDFDVYQWAKGDQYTLESEAHAYATEYNTVAEAVTVNGINGWKYVSIEEFEGAEYTVVNYMFEDNTYILELCFWTVDTDAEYAAVDEIINTLKKS